jgi:diacylglycerol kinase (ATP)
MAKPGASGITRVIKATGYSMKGLKAAWQGEAAFRQELMLAIIAIPFAYLVAQSIMQFVFLLVITGMVVVVELLNSAIEAVVDKASPEFNELAGKAKDMGSAAVFVTLIIIAIAWVGIIIENYII